MQEQERERRINEAKFAQDMADSFDEEQLSFVKYKQEQERERRIRQMNDPNYPEVSPGVGAQRTRQMQEQERERRINENE